MHVEPDMRHTIFAAVVAAGCAGCAHQSSPTIRTAAEPHAVQLVGCVEHGSERDELVLRGRDVTGTVATGEGAEQGGIPSTTTRIAGDAARNAQPMPTPEERANVLTPRLQSDNAADLAKRVGQRVLVSGSFTPADNDHPYDTLKVASIDPIAPRCVQP
jgi:hypothetical protein